jgi:hypothetical protein
VTGFFCIPGLVQAGDGEGSGSIATHGTKRRAVMPIAA